jgi:hypothetical protein
MKNLSTSKSRQYVSMTLIVVQLLWKNQSCNFEVDVEVTLRLTVSQSVCLGVGNPFWAHDQISFFISFAGKFLCSSSWGALSDKRMGLYFLLQSVGGQSRGGHTLLSHLRLLGSLSVASYDSQGLRWKYSYHPPHGDPVKLREREREKKVGGVVVRDTIVWRGV